MKNKFRLQTPSNFESISLGSYENDALCITNFQKFGKHKTP